MKALMRRAIQKIYHIVSLPNDHLDKVYNLVGVNHPYEVPMDADFSLNTDDESAEYSASRLFAILAAVIVGAVYALAFEGTRLGLLARAVIMNETLARALGIDTSRVRLATFMIGTGLAAVAGVLLTPLTSIDPNMGVGWMIGAFMLAMVSGASWLALAGASLAFGAVQFLVSAYVSPVLGGVAVAVLAALVLRLRPQGFARA